MGAKTTVIDRTYKGSRYRTKKKVIRLRVTNGNERESSRARPDRKNGVVFTTVLHPVVLSSKKY